MYRMGYWLVTHEMGVRSLGRGTATTPALEVTQPPIQRALRVRFPGFEQEAMEMKTLTFNFFHIHVTVHRNKLLFNETNRRTRFQIYSCTKLYMFRVVPLPSISSFSEAQDCSLMMVPA